MAHSRFSIIVTVILAIVNLTVAAPVKVAGACDPHLLQLVTTNRLTFSNPKCGQSIGSKASCIEGIVNVTASANNAKVLIQPPASNSAATELFVEMIQRGSNKSMDAIGEPTPVSGTFGIYSKFCIPSDAQLASKVETVQVLIHGGTLDRNYWDFAPGNSYVDVAASAGYATLAYDRLGSGLSEHPDPITIVQLGIQVEIAHFIVAGLRSLTVNKKSFKNIVVVGHSEGSGIAQNQMTRYPKDYDAAILTGTSAFLDYALIGSASTNMIIANTDPSGRFKGLSNGYLTLAPIPQALQYAFYRYPDYDQNVFDRNLATRQTNALGELLTLGSAYTVASDFTGPVDVVNGEHDFFFCGGDCNFPTDQAAAVKPKFFPAASKGSQSYLVKGAGHNVALHSNAEEGFDQMIQFLGVNGIK